MSDSRHPTTASTTTWIIIRWTQARKWSRERIRRRRRRHCKGRSSTCGRKCRIPRRSNQSTTAAPWTRVIWVARYKRASCRACMWARKLQLFVRRRWKWNKKNNGKLLKNPFRTCKTASDSWLHHRSPASPSCRKVKVTKRRKLITEEHPNSDSMILAFRDLRAIMVWPHSS